MIEFFVMITPYKIRKVKVIMWGRTVFSRSCALHTIERCAFKLYTTHHLFIKNLLNKNIHHAGG